MVPSGEVIYYHMITIICAWAKRLIAITNVVNETRDVTLTCKPFKINGCIAFSISKQPCRVPLKY